MDAARFSQVFCKQCLQIIVEDTEHARFRDYSPKSAYCTCSGTKIPQDILRIYNVEYPGFGALEKGCAFAVVSVKVRQPIPVDR